MTHDPKGTVERHLEWMARRYEEWDKEFQRPTLREARAAIERALRQLRGR